MISLRARLEEVQIDGLLTKSAAIAPKLRVELLSHEAAATYADEWRALAADPLESNGFLEPGFALAAVRHLCGSDEPCFLLVWDGGKLLGLCPLRLPRWFAPQLRVFTHAQIPLGVPLLDRERAGEALAVILAYCRENLSHSGGLMFPMLPQEGPTARLLRAAAATEGRAIRLFGAYERAILSGGIHPAWNYENALNAGRRQKLNKARRRLGALGAVNFQLLSEPDELRVAGEEFLALEAKGWKGQRGTALLNSPRHAAFARSIIAALAAEEKLLIGRLDCASVPIGMGLVIESGGHAFYWKMAHDEEYAVYSPGVLMTIELTRALLGVAEIVSTDSCAGPDQMVSHIWKERMAMADFFVEVGGGRNKFFAGVAYESVRRELRTWLKSVVNGVRRAKTSLAKRCGGRP